MNPLLIEVLRGTTVESRHAGALAIVDAAGGVHTALGDIDRPIFPRSAVKLLQALPLAIGQPVTVIAAVGQPVKGYVLPAQAVTRSPSNETVVWVKAGAERYVPQPVRVQPVDAQTVVVTQGLGPDNRVVVQGASLIAQIR